MNLEIDSHRCFTARFVRMKTKRGRYGLFRTALFEDIRLKSSDAVVEKRLWFSLSKQMASVLADQKRGVMVEFVASVDEYRIVGDLGSVPRHSGLALVRPTNVRVVKNGVLDETRAKPGQ